MERVLVPIDADRDRTWLLWKISVSYRSRAHGVVPPLRRARGDSVQHTVTSLSLRTRRARQTHSHSHSREHLHSEKNEATQTLFKESTILESFLRHVKNSVPNNTLPLVTPLDNQDSREYRGYSREWRVHRVAHATIYIYIYIYTKLI